MTAQKGTKEFCHEYWRKPVPSESNRPVKYLRFAARSQYLVKLIGEHAQLSRRGAILELGTNVGRNLAHLWDAGYRNLTGVEISEPAVELMKETYPEMVSGSRILLHPIEDVIREFGTNDFELAFTMGVLMHLHYESEWVFAELARICRILIVMEAESGTEDNIRFPRQYQQIFEAFGCRQLFHELESPAPDCVTRIFDCRSVV